MFIVAAPLRRMGSKISGTVLGQSAYQLTQVNEDKDVWLARTMEHTVVGKIKDEGGNSRSVHDSQWDGIHGIFTNGEFSAKEIINRYRHLLSIEDSCRISEHELKMRPMYHYSPRRIQKENSSAIKDDR